MFVENSHAMALYGIGKFHAGSSLSSCRDYSGNLVRNGKSFTVMNGENCSQCTCAGGQTRQCINVKCVKPRCENYRAVPGRCCEYTCPDPLPISDARQLAVILSLSIVFLIIVILIIVVWRRAKKYKRYSSDIQTECIPDEPDQIDSVANNQRQVPSSSQSHTPRTAVTLSTIELPPYAPPKSTDPETITHCEPPPPYTPHENSFV